MVLAKGKPVGTNYIQMSIVDDENMGNEGYQLNTTVEYIQLKAYKPEGLFNAIQTLRQLFPAQIESKEIVSNVEWIVPTCNIQDKTRIRIQRNDVRCFSSLFLQLNK